jgi:large subunit ribosomal protein L10
MAEYITKVQPAKKTAVSEIKSKLGEVSDFVVTDYRGLTVFQITELRRKLRETGTEYKVVKNRYAKIALNDLGFTGMDNLLTGPSAVAMIRSEAGAAVKTLFDYAKESPVQIKGGYLEGALFNREQLEMFSKLPTRIELISMLMGTMKAPVQNLVYVLNEPVQKLARTLKAVADQKAGS